MEYMVRKVPLTQAACGLVLALLSSPALAAQPESCTTSPADAHQAAADRYLIEKGESLLSACGIGGFMNDASFLGGMSGSLGSCETMIVNEVSAMSGVDIPTSVDPVEANVWGGFEGVEPAGGAEVTGGFPY